MHPEREYVVLLNELAAPVGRHLKATVHHAGTPLHLAFSVFLFDGNGRTLFQQRARHKPTWPGVWSNACCGHPAPGESLVDAARRRLRFELGIAAAPDLQLALPQFRYRARWQEVWENEVCPVFVATYDGPVRPNPDEVAAVRWIRWLDFARGTPAELDAFSPWSRWESAELLKVIPRLGMGSGVQVCGWRRPLGPGRSGSGAGPLQRQNAPGSGPGGVGGPAIPLAAGSGRRETEGPPGHGGFVSWE